VCAQPSQRAPLPGAGAQPHVSWWGEEGIPRLGATVQVLHEDGVWYPGTLAACEGTKWHIHFEDGDRDVYSLPNRLPRHPVPFPFSLSRPIAAGLLV